MGIALTEPREWNRSLWVQELHVTEGHRGCGLGRRLLERAVEHARTLRMRCVVCETQSSNVPAIRFYRALGFALEGVDLSYYTNEDRMRGEVAVFMKRVV
jgi:ribosomal protein S18 acetylase RimI-like enzyme